MRFVFVILTFQLFLLGSAATQNQIIIDSVFTQPNSEVDIYVKIENQDPFVSFQIDIPIDENLEIVSNSAVLNPQRANGHSLSANIINGNIYRIFAYSFSNNYFLGDTGWVVKFTIQAGTNTGNYPLEIQNAIIGDANSQNILTGKSDGMLFVVGPLTLSPDVSPSSPCEGEATQLFANPQGGTYQIIFNWSSDPPGFQSNLENPMIWPEQNTTYFVEAVDLFETVTAEVSIELSTPATLIHQPETKTVSQGDDAFFSIQVSGSEPFTYQWYAPDGMIENSNNDSLFLENVQLTDSGYYHCVINNPCNAVISEEAFLNVIQTIFSQTINLTKGWNSLSLQYQPLQSGIEELFQPILEEIIIISDGAGYYYPDGNTNTLGNWNYKKGYFIKVSQSVAFSYQGNIPDNKTISLKTGWNFLPVLSEDEIQATFIQNQLKNHLIILKEMIGSKIFWPEKQISTLNRLKPGKSYLIKVDSSQSINF
jgi:hypothetical protein